MSFASIYDLKNSRKNDIINSERINLHGGLAMPYDKKTRDALQAYYETHDFTGNMYAAVSFAAFFTVFADSKEALLIPLT